ncbi:MAG: hypothetical protein ABI647_09725 [Gemmatimonadota bacterium]
MTAPIREDVPAADNKKNLVGGAIVLILLVLGAGAAVWALTGGFGRKKGTIYSVYLPGVPQIDNTADVVFQGAHVGEVVGIDPPRIGLQLVATVAVVPAVTHVATLFLSDSVKVAGADGHGLTISLREPGLVSLRSDAGETLLRREAANRWRAEVKPAGPALTVNGQTVGGRGGQETPPVQTGDVIASGTVQLEWQDVADYSRVRLRLAADKVRKAAQLPDTTSDAFLFGPRSSVSLPGGLGLGKATLRFEPSFGRQAFVTGSDSVIAPTPALDLERTVQSMVTYLNAPAALRREPATRFERVVSDLNRSLSQIAEVGGQLQTILARADAVSREDHGQGMVGRLVLDPALREQLNTTVGRLATLTAPLADTSRSLLARLKMDTLEVGVSRAVAAVNLTLRQVDTTFFSARRVIDSLGPVIKTVRDSLAPILGNTNGVLGEVKGTAKGANKLTNKLLPPFLVTGMAAALAAVLKLVGVF